MASETYKTVVIGVSARALFDMREESKIFTSQGEAAFRAHQKKNHKIPLKTGTVFPLIKKMLALNEPGKKPRFEIVLISKIDAETGHRISESVRQYGLTMPRAAMSNGEFEPEVLKAYKIDLFLSRNNDNVTAALKAGIAAAQVYDPPTHFDNKKNDVHIAFDGDKVLFSGPTEGIYQAYGLDVMLKHERANIENPLGTGPFASLLLKLNDLKKSYPEGHHCPIKISLVSMRSEEVRHLNTLRAWGDQYVDGLYMMGRTNEKSDKLEKAPLLKAIGADIFFDDSKSHTDLSADLLPTGYVPDVQHEKIPSLSEIMNMAAIKKKNISEPRHRLPLQKKPKH